MTRRTLTVALGLVGMLFVLPIVATLMDRPYYVGLGARVLIFAIAALSLDLILGFGGMVSFCQAIYLGIGAYAVGILSSYGFSNGFLHFGIAISASAFVALIIGAMSLRTTGVHFIMITLAFGQMIYFLGISVNSYGGDDGLTISATSDFGKLLDLGDPIQLYYAALCALILSLFIFSRLVDSRFGMVMRGAKSNERRMAAIGFATYSYKLVAFVIAGAVTGLAGALLANQALFVSPGLAHIGRSGEILMMVIMGGMGSLVGPILGAIAYLGLEQLLSSWSVHWQVVLGPILLLIVLFARNGLLGLTVTWPPTLRRH